MSVMLVELFLSRFLWWSQLLIFLIELKIKFLEGNTNQTNWLHKLYRNHQQVLYNTANWRTTSQWEITLKFASFKIYEDYKLSLFQMTTLKMLQQLLLQLISNNLNSDEFHLQQMLAGHTNMCQLLKQFRKKPKWTFQNTKYYQMLQQGGSVSVT